MSKLLTLLRHELQSSGVSGGTIRRVEHALVSQLGSQLVRVPSILPDVRNARASLVQAGIPPRTARWKVQP